MWFLQEHTKNHADGSPIGGPHKPTTSRGSIFDAAQRRGERVEILTQTSAVESVEWEVRLRTGFVLQLIEPGFRDAATQQLLQADGIFLRPGT